MIEHFKNHKINVKKMNSFFEIWGYKLNRKDTTVDGIKVYYYTLQPLN
jgi:hypothetical protein